MCANLGHKHDDESGLIYMRARYYEPGSGRFVSEDPGRRGFNLFTYASSNPVGFIDRTGKDECTDALALVGNLMIALGIMFIGLPDGLSRGDFARSVTSHVLDGILGQAGKLLSKLTDFIDLALELSEAVQDGIFNCNKALSAIAGYTMVCYGQLLLDDAESCGYSGQWWGYGEGEGGAAKE